jgi:glycerol uptake facilitator-like aquaporin
MSRSDSVGCFFEKDPTRTIARRAAVEALGTCLLVFAIAGAGLNSRLVFHESSLLALTAGALVTGTALAALIVAFGAASGGHFNPLISVLQALTGERSWRCAVNYVIAQVSGGLSGAYLANIVFAVDRSMAVVHAANWHLGASELISTTALMTLVFSYARSARRETGPFAVGIWIVAASIATPSASLANPAITLAGLVTAGPLALSVPLAGMYLVAQCVGALIALPLIASAYPRDPTPEDHAYSAALAASAPTTAMLGNNAAGKS